MGGFEPYKEWTPEREKQERARGRFLDDLNEIFRAFAEGRIHELAKGPWYVFDRGKRKVSRIENWSDFEKWFGMALEDCRIAKTHVGNVTVSTVFLGIDHSFGQPGTPVLFETMIFGGDRDECMWRSRTLEGAETDHEKAVAMVHADQEALLASEQITM